MATNTLQRELKILTDADRMRAWLRLTPDEDYSGVCESDIVGALRSSGVCVDERVQGRVGELLALLRSSFASAREFVLAEGTEPADPQDASFLPADAGAPGDTAGARGEDEAAGFLEHTAIRMVQPGETIGILLPPKPGASGADVFGNSVPPPRDPANLALGNGIELDADGRTLRATAAGRVHCSHQRLSVNPALEIRGNVDNESGPIEAPHDIVIYGDVLDTFGARSEGNIIVAGFVGACEVRAAGDLHVRGGIAGKGKAVIEARGDVWTRFCNECVLRAGGDLVITKEAINSDLHVRGRLRMAEGSLVGGSAYARCGGDLRTLGSEGDVRTQIAIGIDPTVFDKCREIDEQVAKRREASAKIRQAVEPLLAQRKRLMPAQRERATELMYEADRMDAGVEDLLREKETMLQKARPEQPAVLRVRERILPGVTIVIGESMYTFAEERKGPVALTRCKFGRVEEMVITNLSNGVQTVLKSRDYRLKAGS